MVVKLATPAAPLLSDGKSAPEAATLDATAIATTWTRNFTSTLLTANQELLERCFVDDCYLRDILVLSRDYRTIQGSHKVAKTCVRPFNAITYQSLILSTLVCWNGSRPSRQQTSNLLRDA